MKREIIDRIDAAWRSVLDGTFAVEELNVSVDDFEFGWLTMTLSTVGGQKFIIDMSEVYSPFRNLREMLDGWVCMEGVMEILIDCERYKVMMGVRPVGGGDYYGVLTCYTVDADVDDALVAVVNMERVAKAIYTALKRAILGSTALLRAPESWSETDLIEEYLSEAISAEAYRQELFNRYLRIPLLECESRG